VDALKHVYHVHLKRVLTIGVYNVGNNRENGMFGLGWPEVGIIAVVALLVFGPKKIPELGSALGKTLKGFKDEMKPQDGEEEMYEELPEHQD
jgi:sec-independent protein translocase protein TatA